MLIMTIATPGVASGCHASAAIIGRLRIGMMMILAASKEVPLLLLLLLMYLLLTQWQLLILLPIHLSSRPSLLFAKVQSEPIPLLLLLQLLLLQWLLLLYALFLQIRPRKVCDSRTAINAQRVEHLTRADDMLKAMLRDSRQMHQLKIYKAFSASPGSDGFQRTVGQHAT